MICDSFKLYEWIDIDKLDPYYISMNPNAIKFLKKYPSKINWNGLSANPNAIDMLEQNLYRVNWQKLSANQNAIRILRANLDKVDWPKLSTNSNAIELLKNNLSKIDWSGLSANPNAIEILKSNLNKIDWNWLSTNPSAFELLYMNQNKINWWKICSNECPKVVKLLIEPMVQCITKSGFKHKDKIDWKLLSRNPSAIHIMHQYEDMIDWSFLSPNLNAIDIIESNLDRVNWEYLSANPHAIHLLKANLCEIDWGRFSKNPCIFYMYKDITYLNSRLISAIADRNKQHLVLNHVPAKVVPLNMSDLQLKIKILEENLQQAKNTITLYEDEHSAFTEHLQECAKELKHAMALVDWESLDDALMNTKKLYEAKVTKIRIQKNYLIHEQKKTIEQLSSDYEKYSVIRNFHILQLELKLIYKIPDEKMLSQHIRDNPTLAIPLLGDDPLNEYHKRRVQRNDLAHG